MFFIEITLAVVAGVLILRNLPSIFVVGKRLLKFAFRLGILFAMIAGLVALVMYGSILTWILSIVSLITVVIIWLIAKLFRLGVSEFRVRAWDEIEPVSPIVPEPVLKPHNIIMRAIFNRLEHWGINRSSDSGKTDSGWRCNFLGELLDMRSTDGPEKFAKAYLWYKRGADLATHQFV